MGCSQDQFILFAFEEPKKTSEDHRMPRNKRNANKKSTPSATPSGSPTATPKNAASLHETPRVTPRLHPSFPCLGWTRTLQRQVQQALMPPLSHRTANTERTRSWRPFYTPKNIPKRAPCACWQGDNGVNITGGLGGNGTSVVTLPSC